MIAIGTRHYRNYVASRSIAHPQYFFRFLRTKENIWNIRIFCLYVPGHDCTRGVQEELAGIIYKILCICDKYGNADRFQLPSLQQRAENEKSRPTNDAEQRFELVLFAIKVEFVCENLNNDKSKHIHN